MIAQFAVLGLLAGGVGLHTAGAMVGVTYAVVVWATLSQALTRAGALSLGPANAVTLGRSTLVGGVAALVADSVGQRPAVPVVVTLVSLATVALLLDAVDGQVARRTGSCSPLGARFDGEIDAFLILVLSVFVAQSLGAWWVLAIGALRYVYVAAGWSLPWLRGPLPRRMSRSTIAAVQGVVLAVAGAGVVPVGLMTAVVAAALAALCWSFARDVGYLWERSIRPATGYGRAHVGRSVPVAAAGTRAFRPSPRPSR